MDLENGEGIFHGILKKIKIIVSATFMYRLNFKKFKFCVNQDLSFKNSHTESDK